MIEVGDKVYVWEEDNFFAREWDNVMGDVVSVDGRDVVIDSIIDECQYTFDIDSVYLVGTGPIMNTRITDFPADEIFEDIPDDPDNVVMKIPRPICAQLGIDIGDVIVVESEGEGLVLRKKEPAFTKEYEDARAQAIEDTEPYDPDNPEGC